MNSNIKKFLDESWDSSVAGISLKETELQKEVTMSNNGTLFSRTPKTIRVTIDIVDNGQWDYWRPILKNESN